MSHRVWKLLLLTSLLLPLVACGQNGPKGNGVAAHGWLQVEGPSLLDEQGRTTVLRGMSSHGITWYPRYLNAGAMKTLTDYGANLFRIAVYTEPNGAYLEDKERSLDYLYLGAESALAEDLYVVIDWHILRDENPNEFVREAEAFFDEISSHYAGEPGVIYEICNEPNGDTTWADIKDYAQRVIPVIRANSPKALIIVGTPNYCTDFSGPLDDPLEFDNVMYAMHRYVDISRDEPCDPGQLPMLIERGLPVFVSEWGVSAGEQAYLEENGSGMTDREVYPEAAQPFVDLMAQYGVSWAGWSLSNKAEWHSALRPDCRKLSGWQLEDLTVSGKLMFQNFGE